MRNRVKAKPVIPDRVTLDHIPDERARELMIEELRRLTLSRVGKLVERVQKYNPKSGSGIQPYHNLFPIPQAVIDANSGAVLDQNPQY